MQTIQELINEYNDINKKIEDINSYIKENNREKVKAAITMPSSEARRKLTYHTVLKEEKSRYIRMLNDIKDRINTCCTFDFNMIIDFILDVISRIENETYIKNNIVFSKYKKLKFIGLDDTEDICLIADYNNMSEIKALKNRSKLNNSLDIMDYIGFDKYILVDRGREYNLFDFETLDIKKEITVCFPYLRDILIILVNKLLSGKSISLATEEILNNLSNTYIEEEPEKVK